MIRRLEDPGWMTRAIEQSKIASNLGESPFGAVIVSSNRVISSAHNETKSQNDPTAHAEMVAIRKIINQSGRDKLKSATLYTTCAPCLMCIGAAYYAGITRVVYAARICDAVELGSGDPPIEPSELHALSECGLEFEKDVLRESALLVMREHYKIRGEI